MLFMKTIRCVSPVFHLPESLLWENVINVMFRADLILNCDWEVNAFLNMFFLYVGCVLYFLVLALSVRNYQQDSVRISHIGNHLGHTTHWAGGARCQLLFLTHEKHELGYVYCLP